MPTTPLTNIRSASPEPNATVLGDGAIHQILRHPEVESRIPELALASRMLRQTEAGPVTGCRSCSAGRRIRQAIETAKMRITAMPPARLVELKAILGVKGKLKIFTRQGAKIIPVVV